jgi:hypothetical protein
VPYNRKPNPLPFTRLPNVLHIHRGDNLISGILQTLLANSGTLGVVGDNQNCSRLFHPLSSKLVKYFVSFSRIMVASLARAGQSYTTSLAAEPSGTAAVRVSTLVRMREQLGY